MNTETIFVRRFGGPDIRPGSYQVQHIVHWLDEQRSPANFVIVCAADAGRLRAALTSAGVPFQEGPVEVQFSPIWPRP